MQSSLPDRDIVLLGIGHTNAHVLRMWKMQPLPRTRLTCLSDLPFATYSGMLPGVLAGQYSEERMTIDLVRLTAACGARLLLNPVTGINPASRQVHFRDRPPIHFDALSIGIGSVPSGAGIAAANDAVVPVKPMQTFLRRLEARLQAWAATRDQQPLRVCVVGGGAGGTEVTCCLPAAIQRFVGQVPLELTLIDSGEVLLPGLARRTARLIQRSLDARGTTLITGTRVIDVVGGTLHLDDGQLLEADVILWATGAAPPPLLEQIPLPKDDRGFLVTEPTLKTTASVPVFVVGDTGTIAGAASPKAGVYAVRQGPILWQNLRRHLQNEPLVAYEPQRGFLKLLNTGDGRAVAEYRGLAFSGAWCWKLKDFIDGRFMDKYQNYEPGGMTAPSPADEKATAVMRCAGCGSKVGSTVLRSVLERLRIPSHPQVLLGLDKPDDAAIVSSLPGRPITITADFFSAPLDDPFVVGRIAALNAASDLFAMGAQPFAAVALVTLPLGRPSQQEQLLYDLLAGSLHEFQAMQGTLVGGHTTEGPQLQVGFAILGNQPTDHASGKLPLEAGDRLILTKPLGTGSLLAAHMRAQCRWEWYQPLVESMLRSNQAAAALRNEFTLHGMTDVTGFGLAGHLLSMLRPHGLAARVRLTRLPVLPGALEAIAAGIESTLAPDNRAAVEAELVIETSSNPSRLALLFDPQTSGGLLFGVPAAQAESVLARLNAGGNIQATFVGEIVQDDPPRTRLYAAE